MTWSNPDDDAPAGAPTRFRPAFYLAVAAVGLVVASAAVGIGRGGDAAPTGADPATGAVVPGVVRVEVLNGAGVGGLARTATHSLRDGGFDVVFFGNASRFDHDRSFVLDRTGDPATARAVAVTLGIDSVATEPDPDLLLDVTVVLGADWPPPPVPPTRPLQRMRRLFTGEPSEP